MSAEAALRAFEREPCFRQVEFGSLNQSPPIFVPSGMTYAPFSSLGQLLNPFEVLPRDPVSSAPSPGRFSPASLAAFTAAVWKLRPLPSKRKPGTFWPRSPCDESAILWPFTSL